MQSPIQTKPTNTHVSAPSESAPEGWLRFSILLCMAGMICGLLFPFAPLTSIMRTEPVNGEFLEKVDYWQSGLRLYWVIIIAMPCILAANIYRRFGIAMVLSSVVACLQPVVFFDLDSAISRQIHMPLGSMNYTMTVQTLPSRNLITYCVVFMWLSSTVGLFWQALYANAGFETGILPIVKNLSKLVRCSLAGAGLMLALFLQYFLFPSNNFAEEVVSPLMNVTIGIQLCLVMFAAVVFYGIANEASGLAFCAGLAMSALLATKLVQGGALSMLFNQRENFILTLLPFHLLALLAWSAILISLSGTTGPMHLMPATLRSKKGAHLPETAKCPTCGTVTSTKFVKCHQCFSPLPWIKTPKAPHVKTPKVRQGPRLTLGNGIEAIDWGWWVIVVISFVMPPAGLMLYFAFSRTDDDRASAAAFGGLAAVALFILRFWLLMYRASQPISP